MKLKIHQSKCLIFILAMSMGNIISAQNVVDNTLPRLDESGKIVDAHDGRVIQFGDKFYWYGTSYGTTNGFTTFNHYVCYSSSDLKTWKKEGKLLPDQPEGVYYRPHVIYNKKTNKYVLWYNWYPKLWNGRFGVAISENPEGPYKIINDNVKMARSDQGLGDFGLFVDDDNTAYISYNTIQDHQLSIEKLKEDYLSSTMENGGVIAKNVEAGSQFKRKGKYYLLTDYTCCFCNYGSGARVYVSNKPLAGYKRTTNINRYPGKPVLTFNKETNNPIQYETLIKNGEEFNALQGIFDNKTEFQKIRVDVFTGNRPANCGDVDNPRVHPKIVTPEFEIFEWDFDHWEEIEVEAAKVEKFALKERLILNFKPVRSTRIKIRPKKDYSFKKLYVSDIEVYQGDDSGIDWFITGGEIPQRPIIPAQQTYVMQLNTKEGEKFIWMGDLWGSASDNIKGHDYQFWSAPLQFRADGTIKPLEWIDKWSIQK